MTRKHTLSMLLNAPAEQVSALLHTPSAICQWWQDTVEGIRKFLGES